MNIYDEAAKEVDVREAATSIPIAGVHTEKSLQQTMKRSGDIANDMNVGRTLIAQAGMMNSNVRAPTGGMMGLAPWMQG